MKLTTALLLTVLLSFPAYAARPDPVPMPEQQNTRAWHLTAERGLTTVPFKEKPMAEMKVTKHGNGFKDLTGQRFARWLVIAFDPNSKPKYVRWICRCDCGNERSVMPQNLKSGISKSCGCLKAEVLPFVHRTHGHRCGGKRNPEYTTWANVIARCCNPNNTRFNSYGGRGIAVCERWRVSFENFLDDMGKKPSSQHSIERIDNDGPYSPENCRWATDREQRRNKRTSRTLTAFGRTRCIQDWAKDIGMGASAIAFRLQSGWSPEDAVTTPSKSRRSA